MKLLTSLKNTFLRLSGIEKARDRRRDLLAAMGREKLEMENKRREREAEEIVERISCFPRLQLTKSEFEALPKGSEVDLKTCSLGTRFLCNPIPFRPDIIVVGQMVKGGDLIAEQWGAGMSTPERGINRHLAIIIG